MQEYFAVGTWKFENTLTFGRFKLSFRILEFELLQIWNASPGLAPREEHHFRAQLGEAPHDAPHGLPRRDRGPAGGRGADGPGGRVHAPRAVPAQREGLPSPREL